MHLLLCADYFRLFQSTGFPAQHAAAYGNAPSRQSSRSMMRRAKLNQKLSLEETRRL